MIETTVHFGGTLFGALDNFCSMIRLWSKDKVHAEALQKTLRSEYREKFPVSLRVFTAMRAVIEKSYPAMQEGGKVVQLISARGFYFLEWREDYFSAILMVPRSPSRPFQVFLKGEDINRVKNSVEQFGVREYKIVTSGETLLNMKEFGELHWNDTARAVKVPYWEWLALLRKYHKTV